MRNIQQNRNDINTQSPRIRVRRRPVSRQGYRAFKGLTERTEATWPPELGHPYKFAWRHTLSREFTLSYLCMVNRKRLDPRAKELLRFLVDQFRVSQQRRKPKVDSDFAQHRWTWITNKEVTQCIGLNDDQIKRARATLVERRLIDFRIVAKANYTPHYRPTTDLFKLFNLLCCITDARAVEHFTDCLNPMPTVEANERVCSRMEHHEDAIAVWLMDFAESKDKARYRVFEKQYLALFDQCLAELLREGEK